MIGDKYEPRLTEARKHEAPRLTRWQNEATCARYYSEGRTDYWFVDTENEPDPDQRAHKRQMAAALCKACPALEACRAYSQALKPTDGIWAGVRWVAGNGSSAAGQPSAKFQTTELF